MNVKYLFCKAIKRIMDSIKEGKSVTQIISDVNIEPIPHVDKTGTEYAMLKLSERVLQLKGVSNVILGELFKQLEDAENVGIFAFTNIAEKISLECSEVLSLVEADDLIVEYDQQRNKIEDIIEHPLLPMKVIDTQKEAQCGDLEVLKIDGTQVFPIQQESVRNEPKVHI